MTQPFRLFSDCDTIVALPSNDINFKPSEHEINDSNDGGGNDKNSFVG